ncbi:MAG TPA: UDP-N-acetylglucosamine 1-carboxyvinyltransferase [Acidimicrobiales bacterium]|nr:UDP-N-acetylglucosamine 1-carboxyvinyltransferase [Acidimicrobiales bacterium]
MDRLVIRPNGPLEGTTRAGGAKNSVLKLMAACLLAEGRHELHNVPHIVDVQIMADMLVALGVSVNRADDTLVIDVPPADALSPEAPYELVEKMRASIVVLGPLLARCGHARLSMPGGDDFGSRPINFHLNGLADMGTQFVTRHGFVEGTVEGTGAARRLVGTRIVLDYPSHTTTDNLMMAAALAKGTTIIENAAREPEVSDLASYVNSMGGSVRGAGTSRLEITGVDRLEPSRHVVIPDRVVTGTLLAAVAIAGGELVVEDGRFDHMEMYVSKLRSMGVEVDQRPDGLWAAATGRLTSVDVATLPYPGVATDYKPLIVTMLAIADGVAIVTENLFEGRFRYVDELLRMGADIRTEGHHAVVRGVPRLSGAQVRSPDIRGGAALVLIGLVADGETVVTDAHHLDRGYEDFAATLRSLGADVERR